eukprot:scaffold475057_cov37-Prasinocladus_malaysianus.AAC.1
MQQLIYLLLQSVLVMRKRWHGLTIPPAAPPGRQRPPQRSHLHQIASGPSTDFVPDVCRLHDSDCRGHQIAI